LSFEFCFKLYLLVNCFQIYMIAVSGFWEIQGFEASSRTQVLLVGQAFIRGRVEPL